MPIFTLYDQSHESKGCWTGRPTDGQADLQMDRETNALVDRFDHLIDSTLGRIERST